MRPRPPWPARLLVNLSLRDPLRTAVLSDMEALHARKVTEHGPLRAGLWYWKQAARALLAALRHPTERSGGYERPLPAGRRPSPGGVIVRSIRVARRSLRIRPGGAALVAITLALGVGAATASYAVLDEIILSPLPYGNADRLAAIRVDRPGAPDHPLLAGAEIEALGSMDGLRDVAAVTQDNQQRVVAGEGTTSIRTVGVTPNLFRLLQVSPRFGRLFTEEDRGRRAVVVSWQLWERLGGTPELLGSDLRLGTLDFVIVGVLSPGFRLLMGAGTDIPLDVDAWIPVSYMGTDTRFATFRVLARLDDGVAFEQLDAELASVGRRLRSEYPEAYADGERRYRALPLHADVVAGPRLGILALFAGVCLVFVVAVLNAASVLSARVRERSGSRAVRAALGATRGELAIDVVAECGLVCVLATMLGGALAAAIVQALPVLGGLDLPRLEDVAVSGRVLGFCAALSLVALTGVGLLAARSGGRTVPRDVLGTTGGRVSSSLRSRRLLLVGQVAISIVLLMHAGLLARTVRNLALQPLGFAPRNVATVKVVAPFVRVDGRPDFLTFFRQLQSRTLEVPGVTAAGVISRTPLVESSDAEIVDARAGNDAQAMTVDARWVTPGYFDTLEIRPLHGRLLKRDDETAEERPVVIDDWLASALYPDRSAIGETIETVLDWGQAATHGRVVGVVPHARLVDVRGDVRPQVYIPMSPSTWGVATLLVRHEGDAVLVLSEVREAADLLGARNVYDQDTLSRIVADQRSGARALAALAAALAAVTLVVSLVGLYAMVSTLVVQRNRETGIRMALGAARGQVIRSHLASAVGVVAAGGATGLLVAGLTGTALGETLYGVSPHDPRTIALVTLTYVACGLLAAWLPARHAASAQPSSVLRSE